MTGDYFVYSNSCPLTNWLFQFVVNSSIELCLLIDFKADKSSYYFLQRMDPYSERMPPLAAGDESRVRSVAVQVLCPGRDRRPTRWSLPDRVLLGRSARLRTRGCDHCQGDLWRCSHAEGSKATWTGNQKEDCSGEPVHGRNNQGTQIPADGQRYEQIDRERRVIDSETIRRICNGKYYDKNCTHFVYNVAV